MPESPVVRPETARLLRPGPLPYAGALELMRHLARLGRGAGREPVLILTEHPPVVTLGVRSGQGDWAAEPERLDRLGVEVCRVERGGLATLHSPGQIMLYPVFHLPSLCLGVRRFVHLLEEAVIKTLAWLGIAAFRREDHPGVWVEGEAGPAKVASLGLAVKRGVTLHGLALNLDPDLELFGLINPCGLSAGCMTSVARLLDRPPDREGVEKCLARELLASCGLKARPDALTARERQWAGLEG